MKPRTFANRALLLAQAIVGVAVLTAAGGPRLAVIAVLAAAGVLLTRQRSARALAGGLLTAAAIAVIATGQAKSQPLHAHSTTVAPAWVSASSLQVITDREALVGLQNPSTTSPDNNRELPMELTSAPLLGRLAAAGACQAR